MLCSCHSASLHYQSVASAGLQLKEITLVSLSRGYGLLVAAHQQYVLLRIQSQTNPQIQPEAMAVRSCTSGL